jgi:hypothetical protein
MSDHPRTDALWAGNRGSESLLAHARILEAENAGLRKAGERLLAFSRHGLSAVEKEAAESQMEEALRGKGGAGE